MSVSIPINRGAILTFSFGITAAMWAIVYFTHLPGLHIPIPATSIAVVMCLVGGGILIGQTTENFAKIAAFSGLGVGLLNLMILGSLLASDEPNVLRPSAPIYIFGFILVCIALLLVGAFFGSKTRTHAPFKANWTARFSLVAAAATLLLVTVGGFVTSKEAGLAVVDWPNSFGYNMFLYPLSRMTGGIYYEHAHRLIGSLVGLTVLTLAIHLFATDRRRWLKVFVLVTFLAVVVQGIFGGLRVTGYFTWTQDPAQTAPNIILAIIHGIIGQSIFAALVAISVFTTSRFKSHRPAKPHPAASTDRLLGATLIVVIIIQLIAGAILRHILHGLALHVTLAVFALAVVFAAGLRAWLLHGDEPILRICGESLVALAFVQLALGLASLIITGGATTPRTNVPATEALITTAHQAVGALLLAAAVALTAWSYRLIRPPEFEITTEESE